jgi:hypothetical protein
MCHSVEMYMPSMARSAAEQRVGVADFAAAASRRRFGIGAVLAGFAGVCKLAHISKALKNKESRFEPVLWLTNNLGRGRARQAAETLAPGAGT